MKRPPSVPYRFSLLTVLGGFLILTGCRSPETETAWKDALQTESTLHTIEKAFQKNGIPYEEGSVSYRVIIRNDLSQPRRGALADEPQNLEPSHILKEFRFYLEDIPMDYLSTQFPESGHPLTGDIRDEPVPHWILDMDEDLQVAYAHAQQGDMEAIYSFSMALYDLESPFVPKLDPLAFSWKKKAADTGHGQAAYETAITYFYGEEVATNPEKGQFYMDLAVQLNNPEGLNYRAYETATLRVATVQQLQNARVLIRKALGFQPANPDYLDTLALLEARLGNWETALNLQIRAVDLYEERYTVKDVLIVPVEEQETLDTVRKLKQAYLQKIIPENIFYLN